MQKRKNTILGLVVILVLVAGMGAYWLVPRHQSQYCWLVFGPESRLRLLVKMDSYGNQISLTHFVDGKPTGRVDQFPHFSECKNISVSDPDGQASYLLNNSGRTCTHVRGDPTNMFFDWMISGPLQYNQYCDVMLMPCEPDAARLAYFNGPLTIQLRRTADPADLELKRGGEPTRLNALLGTFDPEKGCWAIIRLQDRTTKQRQFPKTIHPLMDVEFPSADGQGVIKRRYPMPEIIGGVLFQGPIPVPDDAANGTAKIRFSFERWKGANVASSTVELPVVGDKPEQATSQ